MKKDLLTDGELFLLIAIVCIIAITLLMTTGCSVKVCECNDNSPKTVTKTVDRNSSETQVLTIPRSL